MTDAVVTLMKRAEELGVELWVEGGKLRYRCRANAAPREFLDQLGTHREMMLEHLASRADSQIDADELVPTFEPCPDAPAKVQSFRQASWDAIKAKLTRVDSTNCRFVVRIRGYLDRAALLFALEHLRQHHEVLTATIQEVDGQPWLVHGGAEHWAVEQQDLTHLPGTERESAAQVAASELVWRPLDIERGGMFRAFVIALDREDHVLGLVVHHLITDTISMRLLSESLVRSYSLKAAGHPVVPTQSSLQYRDFLLCTLRWLSRPVVQARLREWTDRFAAVAPMDLVHRPPRPPMPDPACQRHRFEISAQLTAAVGHTARLLETSKFLVLITLQKMLLSIHTEERNVTMGAVTSGRELPDLAPVVGYLTDRLHWITDLGGDPTFAEALARVNASYLHALRYQFFRSDMLRQALAARGKWLHAPVFNFMPYSRPRANATNQRFSSFEIGPAPCSTIPMAGISYWMMLAETPNQMQGDVRFPHGSAALLARQFVATATMVLGDRSIRLSAVRRALPDM